MQLLRNRYVVSLIVLGVLAGGIFALNADAIESATPAPTAPPAASVDVAMVASHKITDWHEYSGRLEAVDYVLIRPLVSGTLTSVHFEDGQLVQKGDVLFTIDPRPYQAAVDRAKASVAAAHARAAYTATDLARGKRLRANNAIAQRDFETKQNASREARANLLEAQAALASAALDLEHTRVVAPIAGRVSRAEVTQGNVVNAGPGAAPLTSLVSISRMYASFDLDEQSFLKFVRPAGADMNAAVFLGLANERDFPRRGRLASVDNRLDSESGTIRVRAIFDNADGTLVPGLYARVRLGAGQPRDVVVVDEKAIGTDQNKRFVIVVNQDNKTAYREVQVGAGEHGWRAIEAGLQAGERIVVSGLQRIRPGDPVTPKKVAAVAGPQNTARDALARLAQTADNS